MSWISATNGLVITLAAVPVLIDVGPLPTERRTSILSLMLALQERSAQDDGVPLTHSQIWYMAHGLGNKVPHGRSIFRCTVLEIQRCARWLSTAQEIFPPLLFSVAFAVFIILF